MVHALEETRRLIKRGGVMVNILPVRKVISSRSIRMEELSLLNAKEIPLAKMSFELRRLSSKSLIGDCS